MEIIIYDASACCVRSYSAVPVPVLYFSLNVDNYCRSWERVSHVSTAWKRAWYRGLLSECRSVGFSQLSGWRRFTVMTVTAPANKWLPPNSTVPDPKCSCPYLSSPDVGWRPAHQSGT